MGLFGFGKSFQEKVTEAVNEAAATTPGVSDIRFELREVEREVVALVRRFAIPRDSLEFILRHTVAIGITGAKIMLRFRDALLGRFPVPAGGGDIILAYAGALIVHDAEVELGFGIAEFRERQPFIVCGLIIAFQVGLVTAAEDRPGGHAGHQWRSRK